MACKDGKCEVKFKAKGKPVSFSAKEKANKPGLYTTEKAKIKSFLEGCSVTESKYDGIIKNLVRGYHDELKAIEVKKNISNIGFTLFGGIVSAFILAAYFIAK